MSISHTLFFLVLAFALLSPSPLFANAQSCSEDFLTEVKKINIPQHCRKKTLGAEFAWSFNKTSRQLDIAFGAMLDDETAGWLAWGLNPQGRHMVGTRALIGIKQQNSSLEWHQYNITDATKRGCPLLLSDDIGLNVSNYSFVYLEGIGYYVILATILLPYEYNSSRTNVVWQIGKAATEREPRMHPKSLENFNTAETIDLVSDKIISYTSHNYHRHLRTVHGILNIVGWGIFLPTGVIVARYFKRYPKEWKWWFVFHVSCQSAGYITGSTGWALGIWLGKTSKYYCFPTHRILGIIIFTFTTVQMLALRLKPKYSDEYRTYWNMYHHFLGYALLALISVNIFEGIKILAPDHAWKWAYIGVLGAFGAVVLAFEVFTWTKFLLYKNSIRQY
ncbi:hypothetical protein Pfo_022929 [Paulownia fortunei]|nr:hypothetical protein Pfo_022929 [Paulownia fortunei]